MTMRFQIKQRLLALAGVLLMSSVHAAWQWSTPAKVLDVQAVNAGGFLLTFDRTVSAACTGANNDTRRVYVYPDQAGLTVTSVRSMLSVATLASASGQRVAVQFDDSTPYCWSKQIKVYADGSTTPPVDTGASISLSFSPASIEAGKTAKLIIDATSATAVNLSCPNYAILTPGNNPSLTHTEYNFVAGLGIGVGTPKAGTLTCTATATHPLGDATATATFTATAPAAGFRVSLASPQTFRAKDTSGGFFYASAIVNNTGSVSYSWTVNSPDGVQYIAGTSNSLIVSKAPETMPCGVAYKANVTVTATDSGTGTTSVASGVISLIADAGGRCKP